MALQRAVYRPRDAEHTVLHQVVHQEIGRAFAAMLRERAGALLILPDAIFQTQRRQIAELAAKGRLPAVGRMREDAEAGYVMAYGANYRDLVRRAATFVAKILKGAKPAVPSAPGAAGVRVREVMSRGPGPRTGAPPPKGVDVGYPLVLASPAPVRYKSRGPLVPRMEA